MDEATISHYNRNAKDLASRYDRAEMADVHRILLRYLPESGRVLEIGCGSGRDAAFLVRKEFDVTGVDASIEMLASAVQNHPELDDRLVCQGFPFPQDSPLLSRQFNSIVSIATFMHIPDQDLFECAAQIRDLLPPDGVLVVSVSVRREGIVDGRDAYGRLNIERPLEQLQLLFERLGFWFVAKCENDDSFARSVKWYTLIMQRVGRSNTRSVDEVETIISRDRKDATYKLALLRALCDIAQTGNHIVKWHHNGIVSVPLGLVAEKWLLYYWPLIELDGPDGRTLIPQKRGLELRKPISFRKEMRELISFYRVHGGLSSMYHDYKHGTIPRDGVSLVDSAINKIARTIVAGPVRYAGGALEKNQQYFSFEGHHTAKWKCTTPSSTCEHLGWILVPAGAWREFCLIGHWISESLVLRWAELTHEISNRTVAVKDVVDRLLVVPESERDVQLARSIYSEVPDLRCVSLCVNVGETLPTQ